MAVNVIVSWTQVADSSIECLLAKRPDLVAWLRQNRPYTSEAELRSSLDYWWGPGNGQFYVGNKTIVEYLKSIGCWSETMPAQPPADGEEPPSGFDWSSLLQSKWLLYGVGAFVALKMLRIIR